MPRFAPLTVSLVLATLLGAPPARADFKDDLLKSLIRRITQEALSRILGDRVCARAPAAEAAAPPPTAGSPTPAKAGKPAKPAKKTNAPSDEYCVRVKDGLEKAISGIMNKDFYSVQAGVKEIGVSFLEKKYLDWLGESTFSKELEEYPYLSMKGGDSTEGGLQNFIRKAAAISNLTGLLANIPACIRWVSEDGKSDASACRALLRPELLAKIAFPDDASPDDQERLFEYVNAILDQERPDSYLVDRVSGILETKKLPTTIPELLPLVKRVVHRHADRLAEEFPWLGSAFTSAFPKMIAMTLDKEPCAISESTKGLRAFQSWVKKECVPNEVAMLKIVAETMFRAFPGPADRDPDDADANLEAIGVPLWQVAQDVGLIRNLARRLFLARSKPEKERKQTREDDLQRRLQFQIGKAKAQLAPGADSDAINEDMELKDLRGSTEKLLRDLEAFVSERDPKEAMKKGADLKKRSKRFEDALEKAQPKLAYLVWLKNHPRLQSHFEATILESSSPEKIIGWLHELPQEVAQILVLATTGGDLHGNAKFGHLVLFNSLGPSLDVQAFEEILYMCNQDSSAACKKIRRLLLRSAALRSVVWAMRALVDGNTNKVLFESKKSLMLVAAYFYEELYGTLGAPLRAVLDLPNLAMTAFGGVTTEAHKNGVDNVLDDLGSCVHREYLKALLVYGFDPASWQGRSGAVVEKMKQACQKESDYVKYFARRLATTGAQAALKAAGDEVSRATIPVVAISQKILVELRKSAPTCGNLPDIENVAGRIASLGGAAVESLQKGTLPTGWNEALAKLRLSELARMMAEGGGFQEALEPILRFAKLANEVRGRVADLDNAAAVIAYGSAPQVKATCAEARNHLGQLDLELKKLTGRDFMAATSGVSNSLKVISAMDKYRDGLHRTVTAIGSVGRYFTLLVENLANTLDQLPMFSSLGDFGEPVKKFLTRLVRLIDPNNKEQISRKFFAPFGREVLDLLLKKLFVSNRKALSPLLKAVAELASNQMANLIFEEDTGTLPEKLNAVKRGLLDVFERKSEFKTVPGLQLRLGLLAPFQSGCSPGLPCDAALKTIYREDLAMDLTLRCNAGDSLCAGITVQFPSIVENITRALEGGDKGPRLGIEFFQRNTVQGDTLAVGFGPVARYLYTKEKFDGVASAVARNWLGVGGGIDVTFKFFGNILAGLRGRYFYDHRTFAHPSPEWDHVFEVGVYLGYGFNAVNFSSGQ